MLQDVTTHMTKMNRSTLTDFRSSARSDAIAKYACLSHDTAWAYVKAHAIPRTPLRINDAGTLGWHIVDYADKAVVVMDDAPNYIKRVTTWPGRFAALSGGAPLRWRAPSSVHRERERV